MPFIGCPYPFNQSGQLCAEAVAIFNMRFLSLLERCQKSECIMGRVCVAVALQLGHDLLLASYIFLAKQDVILSFSQMAFDHAPLVHVGQPIGGAEGKRILFGLSAEAGLFSSVLTIDAGSDIGLNVASQLGFNLLL